MTLRSRQPLLLLAILVIPAGVAFAQRYGNGFRGSGTISVPPGTRTQREVETRSVGAPEWKNPIGFEKDVFTFARLRSDREGFFGMGRRGGDWTTDLPDADLNFSFRLQQMTSMKVDPNGRIIRATDPELYRYPFLWASAPQNMALNDAEIEAMRKYLTNGGFFLVDDFWGDREWSTFEGIMRKILPDGRFVELPIEHPIYRSVYKITEKPQVAQSDRGQDLQGAQNEFAPDAAAEYSHGGGEGEVHHRAIFDAKGRIMVLAMHNTDMGDGWEREGEHDYYFHRFSEKMAYPLGINIVFYVMTH